MGEGKSRRSHGRARLVSRGVAKILDHPRTALAVGVIGVAATLATFAFPDAGSNRSKGSTASQIAPTVAGKAPPVNLNEGPSCSDLEQTATNGRARALYVDSPGVIDGGVPGLEGRVVPSGRYGNVVEVDGRGEVEMSAKLHNSDYSTANEVSVDIHVSPYRGTCWRLIGVVNSKTNGAPSSLGPVLIRLNGGTGGTLEYVSGSTTLFAGQTVLVPRLADRVLAGGITLPVGIPGGRTYFVNFRVRIRASR